MRDWLKIIGMILGLIALVVLIALMEYYSPYYCTHSYISYRTDCTGGKSPSCSVHPVTVCDEWKLKEDK